MSKQQLQDYLQRVSAELDACVQFWLQFSHDEEAELVDTLDTVQLSQLYHLLSLQRLLQLPVAGRERVRHHEVLLAAGQVSCCSAAVLQAGHCRQVWMYATLHQTVARWRLDSLYQAAVRGGQFLMEHVKEYL